MIEMNINWEIILSAVAVGISGYSFLSSRRINQKLMNQQLQINELLLKKEQEYIEEKNQAKFKAFTTGEKSNYVLTIVNQGQATAKNLSLEVLIEDKHKNSFYNIDDIFPIDLSAKHIAKTNYSRGWHFPSKFKIKLKWDDNNGGTHEEIMEVMS